MSEKTNNALLYIVFIYMHLEMQSYNKINIK